jgi:hypothetical protein
MACIVTTWIKVANTQCLTFYLGQGKLGQAKPKTRYNANMFCTNAATNVATIYEAN